MDAHYPFLTNEQIIRQFYKDKISDYKLAKVHYDIIANPTKVSEKDANLVRTLYDAQIKFIDNNIGLIMKYLEKEKKLEESLIIITADQGEQFFEHGDFLHRVDVDHYNLYEELLKVPLIFNCHKNLIDVLDQDSLIDISPTILDN